MSSCLDLAADNCRKADKTFNSAVTWGLHHQYLSTPNKPGMGCCRYESLLGFKWQFYTLGQWARNTSRAILTSSLYTNFWRIGKHLCAFAPVLHHSLALSVSSARAHLAGVGEILFWPLAWSLMFLWDAFYDKSGKLLADHFHTSKIFLPWKSTSDVTYTVIFISVVAIKRFNESDWANESLYTSTKCCNTLF